MQSRLTAVALPALAACGAACSAPRPSPSTEPAPAIRRLDGSAITPAQIDATVDRLMAAAHVPGVAIAIINDGRVAYLAAHGLRDLESRAPLTVDTALPAA